MANPSRKPRIGRWLAIGALFVVAFYVGLSIARRVTKARAQREAEAQIESLGGMVNERAGAAAPLWLERLVGEDFFTSPTNIAFAAKSRPGEAMRLVGELPALRTLDLSGVSLADDDLKHLSGLTSLEALFLRDTQIGDAGVGHLAPLINLRRLDLSGTRISDRGLSRLGQHPHLERLWLEETAITGAGLAKLSLAELVFLSLSGAMIADAELAHLARFPALATLRLEDLSISDAGLAHLALLTQMDNALYLAGTPITDAGLPHLALLTRLKTLDLRETAITPAGGQRIRQSLPFCQVGY
jgi:hypothetical protein